MILMQEDNEQRDTQELFIPSEAVRYLREQRGIILSVASLRQRRKRATAKGRQMTSKVFARTSLWTKAELDAIEPSSRTRTVEDR